MLCSFRGVHGTRFVVATSRIFPLQIIQLVCGRSQLSNQILLSTVQ
jgi:hypothetical protein